MKNLLIILLLLSTQLIHAQKSDLRKAMGLFEMKKYGEVIAFLAPKLDLGISDHQESILLSRAYLKEEKYEQAINQLKKSRKVLAKDSKFHFWWGQAYLAKLNDTSNFFEKGIIASKVKEAFEKAVALDGDHLEARQSLARYYLSAPSIAGGSISKAKTQIEYIKSKNPKMGYYAMADYYWSKKDYSKAIEEYQQYLPLAQEDAAAVHYQIGFGYQILKEYTKAFQAFEAAIQVDPKYLNAYYQYARTAVFTEDNLEKGIERLNVYIDSGGIANGPDLASAHWRLGMLYALQDNQQLAKLSYEKALKIDPTYEAAQKALEEMNKRN